MNLNILDKICTLEEANQISQRWNPKLLLLWRNGIPRLKTPHKPISINLDQQQRNYFVNLTEVF